jgi:CspA family cold shock protein
MMISNNVEQTIIKRNRNEKDSDLERVEASVKWYNPIKGYGFLTHEDSSEDILLHFSALDMAKCAYVKEGDRVVCEIAPGKQGLYVVRVIDVKMGSPEPRDLFSFYDSQRAPETLQNLEILKGTVKWYNPDKGFGFVIPDEGTQDIFVHFTIVRQTGAHSLQPGTRVLMKVAHSNRGPEALMVRMLCKESNRVEESAASEMGIERSGVGV